MKFSNYLKSEVKWIFSVRGITVFGVFLGLVIGCQFFDQYVIVVVQTLHLIATAIACLFLGFIGSVIFISVFGLFYYLIGNFSFIVTPEQFLILWFVGYLLTFYSFYKYMAIDVKKYNVIIYLMFSISVQLLFIFMVLIANTYYINGQNNSFWKAVYVGLGFYKNWLTQVIAGILITILIPITYNTLYKKYNQKFRKNVNFS